MEFGETDQTAYFEALNFFDVFGGDLLFFLIGFAILLEGLFDDGEALFEALVFECLVDFIDFFLHQQYFFGGYETIMIKNTCTNYSYSIFYH